MKKEYMKPQMAVLKIETENMIASSITFSDSDNGSGGINYSGATDNAEAKGHRFDAWNLGE